MTIFINSQRKDLPEEINTVSKLLAYLKIPSAGTGVGVNNKIVPARNWEATTLQENDRVMIISATYGG